MARIGIIDATRLRLIPERYQASHEFCFHLHDLMASLLVEMERKDAGAVKFSLDTEEDVRLFENSNDVLDFLAGSGRRDIEQRAVVNHIGIALFADMLHFIYEALIALEKRKFTVALSLLRKPFKEGLLLAAWMCSDEADFFAKLKSSPRESFDANAQTPDRIVAIFDKTIAQCHMDFVTPAYLYEIIFDRKNEFGLAPLFDKSTHLITKNKHIATEDYNINFIFKNPSDNDIYASHYSDLACIILVLHFIQVELYSRMTFAKEKYLRWLRFTSAGAYEALFKSRPKMVLLVNRMFKELMVCPGCDAPVKLYKRDAPTFFISETLLCRACGTAHQFPLGWLLSRLDPEPSP